jgi:hypothetical protein
MGKAPDLKRIAKEDFSAEDQALIEKLAFPLNSHMEQVRNLFSKGIDFDNLSREVITLKVQTGSNGQPINKISFKSGLRNKIKGINIIAANITSNNTSYIQSAPFISFSQENNIVSINYIAGLAVETTYELVLETIS